MKMTRLVIKVPKVLLQIMSLRKSKIKAQLSITIQQIYSGSPRLMSTDQVLEGLNPDGRTSLLYLQKAAKGGESRRLER
jgi:hypothetical protein